MNSRETILHRVRTECGKLPRVAAPPVEIPAEPALSLEEVCLAPADVATAHEAEPAIPSVSPLAEALAPIPAEPSPPAGVAEPLPPVAAAEPLVPSGEATLAAPAEPAAEEGSAPAAENPWQRWTRRLRRREEEK